MTAGSAPYESAPRPAAHPEGLFPIELDSIVAVRQRLLTVTDEDVRSFIDVRREGRPDDPMTILLTSGLAEWHLEHDDFRAGKPLAMYRTGKFYGAQLALDRYKELNGKRLRADDDVAYEAAKFAVFDSYRGIHESLQWHKDYEREQRWTGATTLALLNALLHDHTTNQFYELYGGNIPADEALESFYTGLLDAAIYINTYASMRDHGRMPASFETLDEQEAARPALYHLAKAALQSPVMRGVQIELESQDTSIDNLLRGISPEHAAQKGHTIHTKNNEYNVRTAEILTQTGPNSFMPTTEILQIDRRRTITWRGRLAWIVGTATTGGLSSEVPLLWEDHPSVPGVVLTTGIAAVIGGVAGSAMRWTPVRRYETVWPPESEE